MSSLRFNSPAFGCQLKLGAVSKSAEPFRQLATPLALSILLVL
jgi:hypothetical protein